MKKQISNICDTIALFLAIILYLGAFGGYEAGNYDFEFLILFLLVDSLITAVPAYLGQWLKNKQENRNRVP